jgi:hypothetical protein
VYGIVRPHVLMNVLIHRIHWVERTPDFSPLDAHIQMIGFLGSTVRSSSTRQLPLDPFRSASTTSTMDR